MVARDVPAHADRRRGDLVELLPLAATFAPGEPIAIEIVGADGAHALAVSHLGDPVQAVEVAVGDTIAMLGPVPDGGYLLEACAPDGNLVARTAFDVLADPFARPRYGFVADFAAERDTRGAVEFARRFHLNAVQFYDWMFRHASLLPPRDAFADPLGRLLSLSTVRALADGLAAVGATPLGYAAVYAVGRDEWSRWGHIALCRPDGEPWTLGGDFLWIVDPADPEWLDHFATELRAARNAVGFGGFHLDQYGAPKRAVRRDGRTVDLADSFVRLIEHVRAALPEARLIFNNVNNFPTWRTAEAPQDATYIEVWSPHERLEHLARLVTDARSAAARPVILAAYLSVFAGHDEAGALEAARLTMATIFSHGGAHLLVGEDGAVLTEAYYANNRRPTADAVDVLRRWYDFAVALGDLLSGGVDVTTSLVGGVNDDVVVESAAPVSVDAEPSAIWVRAVETELGLVIHLLDLSVAGDGSWDAPKPPGRTVTEVRLRVRRTGPPLSISVASPEVSPRLRRVAAESNGSYDVVALPAWRTWAVVLVRGRA